MDNQITLSVGDFTTVQINKTPEGSSVSTVGAKALDRLLGRNWSLLSAKRDPKGNRTVFVFERKGEN